ncbi:hypothetical protein ACHHYP_17209 [Achlya hypogyna]|uniref:Uncharacterized protein n=1 Tax=Achlya hypogyna TaxID=1202772 RepID=A0A1V9Y4Y4_ACHHY|nr:hypothetical protein ACHHYP_17209 [Achlya hypogyna]
MNSVARRSTISRSQPVQASLPSPVPVASASVVAWNDFLCPTTYLSHRNTRNKLSRNELAAFTKLDSEIERYLLHAKNLGVVFVLCEDSAATIETLCHRFLPRTARLFSSRDLHNSIHLICAATAITPVWHAQIVYSICTTRFGGQGIALTACGTASLRASCLEVANFVPIVPKLITISQKQPTAGQAAATLKTVTDNLSRASSHNGPIDMTI